MGLTIEQRMGLEPIQKKIEELEIKEVPFMITEQGEIGCLPDSRDMPVIGLVGQRGKGKSFTVHEIIDRLFWYKGALVVVLNDFNNECDSWCMANTSALQVKQMDVLQESAKPLPCVYIYPDYKDFQEPDHEYIKMSLPFEFVLENAHIFTKLKDASRKYLRRVTPHILNCRNMDEIDEVLEREIGNKKIRAALYNVLYDLVDKGTTDFNSKAPSHLDCSNFWQYESAFDTEEYSEQIKKYPISKRRYGFTKWTRDQLKLFGHTHPIYWTFRSRYITPIAIARQGLVPVIRTHKLRTKSYYKEYLGYLVNQIYENQEGDDYFRRNKIPLWIFVDELKDVASTKSTGLAVDALCTYATGGRPIRLGFLYATQHYIKVPTEIRENTTHVISVRCANKEATELQKDFLLTDYEKNNLVKLKTFQIQAMTTEKFVVYTLDGIRYETDETLIGRSLPPLSQHKAPKREGKI